MNRLQSTTETAGGTTTWSEIFGYDEVGNRWVDQSATTPPSLATAFTPVARSNFDASNRVHVNNADYDSAGNQTKIGGYGLIYDAENRPTSSTIGGITATYSYDGDGRRVQKVSGGTTTIYVYDALGQLAAEYSTAPGATVCTPCYVSVDHLGSTRMLTDPSGTVLERHDYLPFGEEIPSGLGGRTTLWGVDEASSKLHQKFSGKERDSETNLDFFGARYMSSAQGRFTSPDRPFADQHIALPQTWNLYAYARNNPLRFVDENGQASLEYLRRKAVRLAWEQERALVKRTGQGTRNWNAPELQELMTKGKVSGYKGHHINNVASNPALAGDPNNIEFLDQAEHMDAHNGGRTRIPTSGPPMARGLAVLQVVEAVLSGVADYRETQVTGVAESTSPFTHGQTYIVDPAQAAITLDGAYIQVTGDSAGLYQVQDGNYTRVGCTDKPESCRVDQKKLKGAQFEIVDPNNIM